MKKLFLLLSLMATISISAQTYKHSFGILAGSYNGLSYKTLVNKNFAIQADLGVGFLSAPGSYFIGPGFIQASEDSWLGARVKGVGFITGCHAFIHGKGE